MITLVPEEVCDWHTGDLCTALIIHRNKHAQVGVLCWRESDLYAPSGFKAPKCFLPLLAGSVWVCRL